MLCFLQEVLGSNIAGMPVNKLAKNAPLPLHVLAALHVDIKAVKMAIYGFLVSAPLGHVLIGVLQRAFAGKTGTGAKIAQLLANNLLVSPIQASGKAIRRLLRHLRLLTLNPIAYLASLAVINGAGSVDEVVKTVKAGFFSVVRVGSDVQYSIYF